MAEKLYAGSRGRLAENFPNLFWKEAERSEKVVCFTWNWKSRSQLVLQNYRRTYYIAVFAPYASVVRLHS